MVEKPSLYELVTLIHDQSRCTAVLAAEVEEHGRLLRDEVLPRLRALNGWRNKVLGAAAVIGGSVTVGAIVGALLRAFGVDVLP